MYMQNKKKSFMILLTFLFLLSGCDYNVKKGQLEKVGLLIPETVNDQVWGTKGYKGLLNIQSKFEIDVYYKEGMNSEALVKRAVKEFHHKGVNLIIGHGNEYAEFFNHLADEYPSIHFVSFNGDAKKKNTTSLNFDGYAMGFFGGMVAAEMTKSNTVGIIAAHDWQPEVKGFMEGATYQNKHVKVKVSYVNDWDNEEKALALLEPMLASGVDVYYPAGDGFNVPVIERIKEKGCYVIGYVSDQSDLGETTVLTSTIQHVDRLYEHAAELYNDGKLQSGNLVFDFQEHVITMGKYSPLVEKKFQKKMDQHIQRYIKTGKLPNE